nr:PREDICTED: sulfhydryl oxidase 1 [Apteryx mantelli mantelli]
MCLTLGEAQRQSPGLSVTPNHSIVVRRATCRHLTGEKWKWGCFLTTLSAPTRDLHQEPPWWLARRGPAWAEWRPAVMIAALDCADEANQQVCMDFGITGFPTLKPGGGEKLIGLLEDGFFQADDALEESPCVLGGEGRARAAFPLQGCWGGLGAWGVPTSAPAIKDLLWVACQDTCCRGQTESFNHPAFGSGDVLGRAHMEVRSFYTYYLRTLSGVTRGSYKLNMTSSTSNVTTASQLKHADRSKVYMADLESALHYSLRVEVARAGTLSGAALSALKCYVALLAKPWCVLPLTLVLSCSAEEVRGFFRRNNVKYLALIFEKSNSFVGREVTLDMLQYENIAVRRVLSSEEELVKKFGVTTFPSGYLLLSNGSFSRLPYFPGRPFVQTYLQSLDGWLRNWTEPELPRNTWKEAVKNKGDASHPAMLPTNVTWVGCQGSEPHFRGYPCSLWTLFHLLTAQALQGGPDKELPLEVLSAMRCYVKNFFGCQECAQHFEAMAAESMDKVQGREQAVLWLWSHHNEVNARLAGKRHAVDVSLCIVLYFLSSMCLLGMYTFFRLRMRSRKGRPGFPTA